MVYPQSTPVQLALFPVDRRCARCGLVKPLYAFVYDNRAKFGHTYYCQPCSRARKRADYHANKERYQATSQAWKRAHPDLVRAYTRRKYWGDPEIQRAKAREWHAKNPERAAAKGRAWREQHPHYSRVAGHKRRVLIRTNGGHFTLRQLSALHGAQEGRCAYCGVSLDAGYEIDHRVPLSRGGSNAIENIALACPSCNAHKFTKTDVEYCRWLAMTR